MGGTHPVLKTELMWAREVREEGSERNEIPADIISYNIRLWLIGILAFCLLIRVLVYICLLYTSDAADES